MKAILYCRVSTEYQADEGHSLEAQAAKLKQSAVDRDIPVVEIITDDGRSGKTLKRPGLMRAFQMLQKDEADTLIVTKLDRLTRSLIDLQHCIYNVFDKYTLISLGDSIDTSTANGRLMINLLGSVLQWEREAIQERTLDTIRNLRETGKVYCKRIYGHRDNGAGNLVEVENEQTIIKLMLAKRAEGESYSGIARRLNRDRVAPPSGQNWYHNTVRDIINRQARG